MVILLSTHYTKETNKLVEVDDKCGHRNDLQKGTVLATLARWGGCGGSRVDEDIQQSCDFSSSSVSLQESRRLTPNVTRGYLTVVVLLLHY